jgi:hypothetical protein
MKKIIFVLLMFISIASFGQSTFLREGVTSGTNTYTATVTSFTSYTSAAIVLKFNNANTSTSTININSIGAVAIRKWDGDSWEPLSSGDIPPNSDVLMIHDNTNTYFKAYVLPDIGQGGGGVSTDTLYNIRLISATSYTLQDEDNGDIFFSSNASGCSVTLPQGLQIGTSATFVRLEGAGELQFTDDGAGSALFSIGNQYSVESENGWASWVMRNSTDWYGTGALGPASSGGGTWGSITGILSDQTDLQTALDAKEPLLTFTASDFNESGQTISLDYANGQAATSGQDGYLQSSDWSTFNGKQAALSGTGLVSFSGTTPSYNTTSSSIASIITDEVSTGPLAFARTAINTQVGSYTLVASDEWKEVQINSASTTNLTLPPDAATPVGFQCYFRRTGAGVTSFTLGSGVTADFSAGVVTDPGQNNLTHVFKDASNHYKITNGSAPVTTAALSITDGLVDLTASGAPGNALNSAVTLSATLAGLSSVANGDMIYANGANTFTNRNVFNTTPTALIHLKAGTATANTAPLKFTSGTNMTTAENGSFEYDGTLLYFTPSGANRYRVMLGLTGSVTNDVASIAAQTTASPPTITVTGAAVGDPVYVGASAITAGTIFTAQVTATNTVTVYITNPTSGALDPPSATYSVRVIKTP